MRRHLTLAASRAPFFGAMLLVALLTGGSMTPCDGPGGQRRPVECYPGFNAGDAIAVSIVERWDSKSSAKFEPSLLGVLGNHPTCGQPDGLEVGGRPTWGVVRQEGNVANCFTYRLEVPAPPQVKPLGWVSSPGSLFRLAAFGGFRGATLDACVGTWTYALISPYPIVHTGDTLDLFRARQPGELPPVALVRHFHTDHPEDCPGLVGAVPPDAGDVDADPPLGSRDCVDAFVVDLQKP